MSQMRVRWGLGEWRPGGATHRCRWARQYWPEGATGCWSPDERWLTWWAYDGSSSSMDDRRWA